MTFMLMEAMQVALFDLFDTRVFYSQSLIAWIRYYRGVDDADSLRQLHLVPELSVDIY